MGVAAHRSPQGWGRSQRLGLRAASAGLLAATAAIHLYLYLTGYRTIPTIGWLFLVQVIPAFLLTAALLVSRSRIVAAAGRGPPGDLGDTSCRCGRACSASPRPVPPRGSQPESSRSREMALTLSGIRPCARWALLAGREARQAAAGGDRRRSGPPARCRARGIP